MHRLTNRAPLLLLPLALVACGGRESSADSPQDSLNNRRGSIQVTGGERRAEIQAQSVAGGDTAVRLADAAPGQPAARPSGPNPGTAPEPAAAETPAPAGAPSRQPASTTPGPQSAQDRATAILRQAETAARGVRSLEADFVQTLSIPLLGTNQRSAGRLYQRKPDRFAMKFTDPAGDVMVADGRYFWIYYPSNDKTQVIRTSVAAAGEQADFERQFITGATERFVATLNGEETVGGAATWALTLVPKGESPYRVVRIWVGKDDKLIHRIEITEENQSVRTVELRNLRVNPSLADAVFTFTPPAGTQVFDQ